MAESQGCSVVVVVMVTLLAFVVGGGVGAAAIYFTLAANPSLAGGTTTTTTVAADCPPCKEIAPVATGGSANYALVYPIEESLRVTGTLSPDLIKDQVKSRRYTFSKCYQDALDKDPNVKGEMSIQFTVSGSTGRIIAAIERDTKIDKRIHDCVFTEIKKWKFEPTKSPDSVARFDMLFVPIGGAPGE